MSDLEQGEITSQPEASTEEEQALETQGQPEQAKEEVNLNDIPEKFVEASKYDVITSYRELEKDRGRLANELGELRKQQEEMAERYKQLEAERANLPQTPAPQETAPEELDPLSVYDSKFDEDPKAAIRAALELSQRKEEQRLQQLRQEQIAQQASEFYFKQKQENPDFARREPVMQQLAQQYSHIIKPEYLNSADAIKVLDLMSRGSDVDYYKKAAIEDAQKHRASVAEEKRRAQTETSNSEGDAGLDWNGMSDEEYLKHMESMFGHSKKD